MRREPCTGAGLPAVGQDVGRFGNGLCPECHGIANVDDAGLTEPHTVLVILDDDE